ncbi:hypothetical protein EMIT0180MI3_30602 [Priestia megaterium]
MCLDTYIYILLNERQEVFLSEGENDLSGLCSNNANETRSN